MGHCFKMFKVMSEGRDADGNVADHEYYTLLADDAEEAFDELLLPYRVSSFEFTMQLDRDFRDRGFWPWAMIAFPSEYRLAGHLFSIRQKPQDFSFSAYSLKDGMHSVEEEGPPPVSIVFFRDKTALKKAAARSELFSDAWKLLKDKEHEQKWFVVSEPPKKEWLSVTSEEDDELFMSLFNS